MKCRFLLLLSLLTLISCSTRSITKPRSQLIAEARSMGHQVRTISEEQEFFKLAEERQKEKVLELIKDRATKENRDETYRLGPQDEVEVSVFDVPELNLSARVMESGNLALPLIGAVPAKGLTESELDSAITERLKTYVKNPEVSVFVTLYAAQKIAVSGAVAKPGTYPLKKGSNIIQEILAEAGGVVERGGNIIYFVPVESSGIQAASGAEAKARLAFASYQKSSMARTGIEIPLDYVLGSNGGIPLEIPVRGGDMIIVPELGKVMVDGEVQSRGAYELVKRMTLLGALAAAGGITYGAKVDEIEVVRDLGGGEKGRLILDLEKIATGDEPDVVLRSGDLVRVPSDSDRRLAQDTFDGFTRVINFGIGGSVNLAP